MIRKAVPRKEGKSVVGLARNLKSHLWLGVLAAMLLLIGVALLGSLPTPAEAAKGGTCESFSVTTGGKTYSR